MKKLVVIIALLVVVVGGYFGYQMLYPKPMPKPESQAPSNQASPDKLMNYSLEQIAEHATKDSCWFAIEGNVYDVTPFVKSGFHPGKDAILAGCGKDATELFNTRPMGSKTPHSEKARASLPKYLIGQLAK